MGWRRGGGRAGTVQGQGQERVWRTTRGETQLSTALVERARRSNQVQSGARQARARRAAHARNGVHRLRLPDASGWNVEGTERPREGGRAATTETSNEGAKGEQWRPGKRSGSNIAEVAACAWVGGGRDLHHGAQHVCRTRAERGARARRAARILVGQVHAAGFVRTVLRTAGGMSVTARKWGVPHPASGRGAQRGSTNPRRSEGRERLQMA